MRKLIILAALLAGCARHPKATVTVGAYTGDKILWVDGRPVKYELADDASLAFCNTQMQRCWDLKGGR